MKAIHRGVWLTGIAVLVLLGYSGVAAQDPAAVNAKTIKVKLENDRVRVLEATLEPGDKEQLTLASRVDHLRRLGRNDPKPCLRRHDEGDDVRGRRYDLSRAAHALGGEYRYDDDSFDGGRAEEVGRQKGVVWRSLKQSVCTVQRPIWTYCCGICWSFTFTT